MVGKNLYKPSNTSETTLAKWVDRSGRSLDFSGFKLRSEMITEGVRFWDRVRGERPFPLRAHVDPLEIPVGVLPHIMLIDVVFGDAIDFRWRLSGTHVTEVMQRDSTGKYWRALYSDEQFMIVSAGPRAVLESGLPCHSRASAPASNRDFIELESVDLPMSRTGERIDMIMALAHGL